MFEQTFKNIDDFLWKEAGCSSELDYTEQTSWLLFVKCLDDLESERAMQAELVGKPYRYLLEEDHRCPKRRPRTSTATAIRVIQTHRYTLRAGNAPSLRFAGLRTLVGGLALLLVLVIRRKPLWPEARLARWVLPLGLVATALTFGAMFASPAYTGAGGDRRRVLRLLRARGCIIFGSLEARLSRGGGHHFDQIPLQPSCRRWTSRRASCPAPTRSGVPIRRTPPAGRHRPRSCWRMHPRSVGQSASQAR